MPRFVLLFHDCPNDRLRPSHCDLMLEAEGALRTWAITALPCSLGATAGLPSSAGIAADNTVSAEHLADHRLAYLNYEGPVSGDRGSVTRIDFGTFTSIKESPVEWIVSLAGQRICGELTLRRAETKCSSWELSFQDSAAANHQ
jgi:hypothetical protein